MNKILSPCIGLALAALIFTSPTRAENILDIYYVAEQQDPVLRTAAAEQQAARERYKQSRSALIVQADASANATRTDREIGSFSEDTDSSGYALTLTQPIYHHSSWKQLAVSDAFVAQADARFEASQQDLTQRVTQRYFAVLGAIDNLTFVRGQKEAIARQLEQTKQRFEVGLIAITDVHEAQAAFDLRVSDEIAAENLLSSTREALRELTGTYHDALSPLTDNLPLDPPQPASLQEWLDMAFENSKELAAANAGLEAARQEMLRRRAGHYPDFDLVGSHSYTSDGGVNVGNEDITNTSIGVQVTLPLSRGGFTMASTAEARYAFEQSMETVEQTRRDIQRRVSDAFRNVQANISRVKALEQALVSTQSALEASEAGLEVGTRTTVDVLNVRTTYLQAQRDHARARYDYVISLVDLRAAAGVMTLAYLEEINALLQ